MFPRSRSMRALLLLLATMALGPVPVLAAKPAPHRAARPAAVDWTKSFAATPEGGIRMGNPAAKVKLVEYFSYTCPHCAVFAGEAFTPITQNYVKTGQVSLELRSALRDGFDFVAAQIARCAGPGRMFENSEAILAAQQDWVQKGIDWHSAHPTPEGGDKAAEMRGLATGSGLEALVGQHGITPDAVSHCVGNQAIIAPLQASTRDAWEVRKISGTPAFFINDVYLTNIFTWAELEPKIQAALKG